VSAERNRPGVGTEAIEAQAAKPFAHSDFTGDIDLTEISAGSSNPRYEVYLAGWSAGYEQCQGEIRRLNFELDRLYARMFNPPLREPSNRLAFADLEALRAAIYSGVTA